MTNLPMQVSKLKAEIEALQADRVCADRARREWLADAMSAPAASADRRTANGKVRTLEADLARLDREIAARHEAIETLEARQAQIDTPANRKMIEAEVKKALAQRAELEAFMPRIAEATDALAAVLKDAADAYDAMLAFDPRFDASGHGRSSVVTWIDDRLSLWSPQRAYSLPSAAPKMPGTLLKSPEEIEEGMRQRMRKRIVAKVRQAAEAEV